MVIADLPITIFQFPLPSLSYRYMSGGLILLDDAAFSPGFSPSSVWGSSHGQLWYQNYSHWAKNAYASTSTYGSFSVTFEGTPILLLLNHERYSIH